ncbi:DUF983 domain-containing protein [Coralliovum pocilloporae]|uniref:DUF983 domain-containing protein n=1 Tax=Coralliovum pocilloporae TaxID=3066369 RepID=UPI00330784DB
MAVTEMHHDAKRPPRSVWTSMWRGMRFKCPKCGEGSAFKSFLKVADNCNHCNEDLSHHRADDAPPYFTVLILGHIIIFPVLWLEATYEPSLWVHTAIWGPLSVLLTLAFLRPIKGSIVGLQWALYMHGFDPYADKNGDPGVEFTDDK